MFTANQLIKAACFYYLRRILVLAVVIACAILIQGCATMDTPQGRAALNNVFQHHLNIENQRQANIERQNAIMRQQLQYQNQRQPAQYVQPQQQCAWNDYWCQTNTRSN